MRSSKWYYADADDAKNNVQLKNKTPPRQENSLIARRGH